MKSCFLSSCFAWAVIVLSSSLVAQEATREVPQTIPASNVYRSLFNGRDLDGWRGRSDLWSVQDASIVGVTTSESPIKGNTFLIWEGDDPDQATVGDFDFRCLVRFEGNNSGVQYRSRMVDAEALSMAGYQADLHPKPNFMGMMYGEKTGRGIIATVGQRITVGADAKTNVIAKLPTAEPVDTNRWNELRIVAVGNRLIHQINGVTTVDITDDHPDAALSGRLGLQLHAGPAMKVEFRGLLLRELSGDEAERTLADAIASKAIDREGAEESDVDSLEWVAKDGFPKWIWASKASNGQKVWFRHTFNVLSEAKSVRLYATCDNGMKLFLNGKMIGESKQWQDPILLASIDGIWQGENVLEVEATNEGGIAGLVLKCEIECQDASRHIVVTNKGWRVMEAKRKPDADSTDWQEVKLIGTLGDAPWGIPGQKSVSESARLSERDIVVAPGFVVEKIHDVTKEQGSWVCLATDPKGRIYASDQAGAGLYRLTLPEDGAKALVEKVSVGGLSDLSGAQGMQWAFDSLWFHRNGGHLFRVTDTDGDDRLDSMQQIQSETGGGEHGNHAVLTTPDGKALFLDGGNHAPLAEQARSSVPTWMEGLLLPRMWDARGHARGKMAPGGWITRLDPTSHEQSLLSIGYRNQYDIALNRHGDLFAYDADMEYDFGLPWYRPTRICFAASGSDFGWRSGSGKWPTYYEDTLPPVVEIGPGSPTGLVSGAGSSFPTRYQDAIFALDWTYGTMYAIHISPDGAGYRGEAEPFLYASPLPLTDAVIAADGSMIFAVGGRGAESTLYRVRYVGDESRAAPVDSDEESKTAEARSQRRELEAYHGVVDSAAIAKAWPLLSSPDRFMRHAARIAVESQPLETWADRVATEPNRQARITASVALARMGNETHRDAVLNGLLDLDAGQLNDGELLGLLRAYALTLMNLGTAEQGDRRQIVEQLSGLLPHASADVNTELVRVLTYLEDDRLPRKVMAMIHDRQPPVLPPWSELAARNRRYGSSVQAMLANHPPTQEVGYAFILRNLREGWSLDDRREYFTFLNEAAKASGGASYPGYLTRIREDALGNCSNAERAALADLTGENFDPTPDFDISEPVGPGRPWTVAEALKAKRGKPDFERGRSLFFGANCASCHRMAGMGGDIGPDLTSVPHKFNDAYVVEAIVNPSKDISDQYGSSQVLTADGDVLVGLVNQKSNGDVMIYPVDVEAKPIELAAEDIESIRPSKVSQMPVGLLDRLGPDEVRDLMAYLMSGGNSRDKRYADSASN